MAFEWNPAKSEATFRARGFDFAYASRIFSHDWIEMPDVRLDYGKARMRAIGQVESDILIVIYTDRGANRRIIFARRANRKERSQWLSRA